MGALRVTVAKKVPKVWEKLGLRKYLILRIYLVCRKYLDTQGVSSYRRSSSGVKEAKEYLGFREYIEVQGIAITQK